MYLGYSTKLSPKMDLLKPYNLSLHQPSICKTTRHKSRFLRTSLSFLRCILRHSYSRLRLLSFWNQSRRRKVFALHSCQATTRSSPTSAQDHSITLTRHPASPCPQSLFCRGEPPLAGHQCPHRPPTFNMAHSLPPPRGESSHPSSSATCTAPLASPLSKQLLRMPVAPISSGCHPTSSLPSSLSSTRALEAPLRLPSGP